MPSSTAHVRRRGTHGFNSTFAEQEGTAAPDESKYYFLKFVTGVREIENKQVRMSFFVTATTLLRVDRYPLLKFVCRL